eukprot:710901-Prymnesium_polylepis.1
MVEPLDSHAAPGRPVGEVLQTPTDARTWLGADTHGAPVDLAGGSSRLGRSGHVEAAAPGGSLAAAAAQGRARKAVCRELVVGGRWLVGVVGVVTRADTRTARRGPR